MAPPRLRAAIALAGSCALAGGPVRGGAARLPIEMLQPTGALPAHFLAGFTEPIAYAELGSGEALVLDRRGHTVFVIDRARTTVRKLAQVGEEDGRIVAPGAMTLGPAGTVAVADAPKGVDRIQYFGLDGRRAGGFYLPDKVPPRIIIGPLVMNGVGSMQFHDRAFLISLPGRGSLVSEVDLNGATLRQLGDLRPTGQEQDQALHVALNVGIPVVDPTGGFFFVFQTGVPMFRKYDAAGTLLFERHIEGLELDARIRALPSVWPARGPGDGQPYAEPLVRAAAADSSGRLWVSLMVPFTYVYDGQGEKVRTIQFEAPGPLSPTSLFFAARDRLLVTPGCWEFSSR